MAKNTKQSFEFNRTERLRRTIFLEDSSEDESLEYTNRIKTRDNWNKPLATLIKPKTKVKVGGRADSLPVSIKPVKTVKKRKPPVTDRTVTVNVQSNVKPKQVEQAIIKIENKQLANQTSTKFKRHV
ncbi:uncharacterized protein LOC132934490 [Metopolophium dirhodum]|uniref:uncharacterized protein LOC132934490 n=1 Tax=Metopolophium dirhodum TaxID=44670 RepID=UPI00298FCCB1|nr:uncharacterized protein LOC132934490 [Metopolophium dirhodum]